MALLGRCRLRAVMPIVRLQQVQQPSRSLVWTHFLSAYLWRDWSSTNYCRGSSGFALNRRCRLAHSSNLHPSNALMVSCCSLSYAHGSRELFDVVSSPSRELLFVALTPECNHQLLQAVKGKLKSDPGVQERQLQLLSAIISDVSDPSKELLAKLNCGPKLSGEEMYQMAGAMFQVREQVGFNVLDIVVPLFQYAGDLGDTNALYTYAQLLRTGQGCAPNASRAAEIFTDLAMKGHPYAQFALAGMYYGGVGVEQSFTKAFTLYKVSAQNFVPQAYNVLGEMYRHGQGVDENIDEAVNHYRKGADLGDPLAHLSLARCYTKGNGVEQSYEKAFQHHLKASESGNPVALYNVGGHYFAGKGVELNFEKAAQCYKEAAKLGFAPAQVNLGNMYYSGLGVSKSRQKAKELYRQAADSDKNAKLLLEEVELEEQKEQQEHQNQEKTSEDHIK